MKKSNLKKINQFLSKVYHKLFSSNKNTILFLSIFSLVSCLFLLKSGIIKGHDLEYHLSRITSISNCLKNGDIRALIHEGVNGYGYANGLFYSNAFLYLPAILNSLGVPIILSYKIFLVVFSLLTAYSMYFCMKRISKSNEISFLASILFTLCSYRICDVMVRAAVGEFLAFIFIPIIILGLYEILFGDYKKFYIFSLGFVGLVNCHLISTVFMLIITVIILLSQIYRFIEEPKRFKYLIYSGILGSLLAAFFIFPLLEQYFKADLLINTGESSSVHTIPFFKLFFGIPNFKERFLPGGIGLIYIYAMIKRFKIKEKDSIIKFSDFCMVIGIITLIACSELLPWNELSDLLGSIQFTWRLLFVSSTFLSISAAIIFYKDFKNKETSYINFTILIIYLVMVCCLNQFLSYYSLRTYYQKGYVDFLHDYNGFTFASGEYLPAKTDWSLIDLDERSPKTNNEEMKIHYKEEKGKVYIEFKDNQKEDTYIDVPFIYYLGYRAKSIDYKNYYEVSDGYNTWIRINIGSIEKDQIVIWYKGTKLKRVSTVISIVSWIFFIAFLIRKNLKINKKIGKINS